MRKRVEKISSIEIVKTNVEKSTGDEIRECSLAGVKVDEDYKRYYPCGSLASKVIGFTGGDNQGIIGLEVKYEEIQRQLYAEIEKNEQVLFIIRSLNSMNPLYEKITKELVASVRGEKTRHIVTSFLKGESIYEIAQREGKSATSVRRMVLLSLMVKTRK